MLLTGIDTHFQPWTNEVFIEERSMTIPEDAAPGKYQMLIGLHSLAHPRYRLSVRTSQPAHHRAVELPCVLEVLEPDVHQ